MAEGVVIVIAVSGYPAEIAIKRGDEITSKISPRFKGYGSSFRDSGWDTVRETAIAMIENNPEKVVMVLPADNDFRKSPPEGVVVKNYEYIDVDINRVRFVESKSGQGPQ
jgi:hypothetical protein